MSKCCVSPPNPLVKMAPKEKICKVTLPSLNIFNLYTLNKQQNMKTNNAIDYSATKIVKGLGKDAVFIYTYSF